MGFFAACPEMRDSARRVLPVLHGRAGRRVRGCPGRDRLLEDFRIRPSFGDCCGPGMGSLQSHFARRNSHGLDPSAGPFAGVFLLAGRKYRKSLPKESKFCRCISALWKIHKALWQGSSVGQSMRFIPAVSGVQIPPLLPEIHKRFGSVPDRFFVMAVSVNTAVRNAASSALRELFIFCTSRHPGHRQLPVRISACGCSGPDRKQGWTARTGKAYGP